MAAKKIKRLVRELDTSNQLSLFSEVEREADLTAGVTAGCEPGRVRFVSRDPHAIFINQVRLDEHLRAVGLKGPLRLRPLLETLSFAGFEQVYRAGGRPPYAPQAMVGLLLYGIM